MVLTPSTMLQLGTEAPDFHLPGTDGQLISRDDLDSSSALLVMFICNHCPFVKHLRTALAEFGRQYQAKGLAIVAVSSNDVTHHPDDSPELMKQEARDAGYTFAYLYDEDQSVAKAYRAACTPDFFLFDGNSRLVYRGQFDGSRPGNEVPVTGTDLRAAADAVLAGQPAAAEQIPSMGCNIKWKVGNEPDYFGGTSRVRNTVDRLVKKLKS